MSKRKTLVRVEIEAFLEDIHDLDMGGFAYTQRGLTAKELAEEEGFDKLAEVKLASFLHKFGRFIYTNVKGMERIDEHVINLDKMNLTEALNYCFDMEDELKERMEKRGHDAEEGFGMFINLLKAGAEPRDE